MCRFVTHPEPGDKISAPERALAAKPQGTGGDGSAFARSSSVNLGRHTDRLMPTMPTGLRPIRH